MSSCSKLYPGEPFLDQINKNVCQCLLETNKDRETLLLDYLVVEKTIQGDIRVGFVISKGQLEVEIVCAKGLPLGSTAAPPGECLESV